MRPGRTLARRSDRQRRPTHSSRRHSSLCESLNRVLDVGAVVVGELVISVAGVDLIYINLNVLVSSVETLLDAMETPGAAPRLLAAGAPEQNPIEEEVPCATTT